MRRIRKIEDVLRLNIEEAEEIYVVRRLSKKFLALLLTLFPNLRRIYVPRSIYQSTPSAVLEALERVGVSVVPTDRKRGRPPKYREETLKLILEKYKSGEKVQDISRELGVPTRTVYHLLRRLGLRGENPRHKGLRDFPNR